MTCLSNIFFIISVLLEDENSILVPFVSWDTSAVFVERINECHTFSFFLSLTPPLPPSPPLSSIQMHRHTHHMSPSLSHSHIHFTSYRLLIKGTGIILCWFGACVITQTHLRPFKVKNCVFQVGISLHWLAQHQAHTRCLKMLLLLPLLAALRWKRWICSVVSTKSLGIICLSNSGLSLQVKHMFGCGDLKAIRHGLAKMILWC